MHSSETIKIDIPYEHVRDPIDCRCFPRGVPPQRYRFVSNLFSRKIKRGGRCLLIPNIDWVKNINVHVRQIKTNSERILNYCLIQIMTQ